MQKFRYPIFCEHCRTFFLVTLRCGTELSNTTFTPWKNLNAHLEFISSRDTIEKISWQTYDSERKKKETYLTNFRCIIIRFSRPPPEQELARLHIEIHTPNTAERCQVKSRRRLATSGIYTYSYGRNRKS